MIEHHACKPNAFLLSVRQYIDAHLVENRIALPPAFDTSRVEPSVNSGQFRIIDAPTPAGGSNVETLGPRSEARAAKTRDGYLGVGGISVCELRELQGRHAFPIWLLSWCFTTIFGHSSGAGVVR